MSLTMRFREAGRDGWDIADERGNVVDTITATELATAEHPHRLVERRVYAQQKVARVRRFCEQLRATE